MRKLLLGAISLIPLVAMSGSWTYRNDQDKMTGKETKAAIVRSENSLKLQFPYAGENYGNLAVRRHPKYGTDVIVSVDKGQVMCRSYDPCKIAVKFDDAPPVTFSGTPPEDNDSTVVFLSPAGKFIDRAVKAKRILVELTLYQAGANVLEFTTPSPLTWDAGKK